MATVDEKIVKLTVNNAGFESKLSASASALQKLNQVLGRGIGGGAVAADAKQISAGASEASAALSDMEGKTSRLRGAFDTLKIAAGVAMGNIATRAVEAGARLVSSLTLKPLFDGIAEYNLQMGSVQTILANTKSKGEDIKSVTKALDELNRYADLTIYNFGEMTANIGRFTAAGVGLDDSVAAIKGISNLAALSGSSAQQASSAMYQLSQAIASGTVKLMDWNSVVNAGMGGEQFQEALKTTARVHGVNVDAMIEKNGSFRDSLQEGWLSSEIMLETLSALTGDLSEAQLQEMGYSAEQAKQMAELGKTALNAATEFKTWADVQGAAMESLGSGWAKTWQIIFGDYEESKALWTEVGNAITGAFDKIADSRNNFLQGWKDLGGRTALINGLRNAITALTKPLAAIGRAFGAVFSGISPKNLADATKAFERFTQSLIISDSTAGKLQRAFQGLFSVFHIVWTVFSQVAKVGLAVAGTFVRIAAALTGLFGSGALNVGSSIGDLIFKFDAWLSSLDLAGKALEKLQPLFDKLANGASTLASAIRGAFGNALSTLSDFASSLVSRIPVDTIKAKFNSLRAALETFKANLKVGGGDSSLAGAFVELKEAADAVWQSLKRLLGITSSSGAQGVKEYAGGVKNAATDLYSSASDMVKSSGVFQTIKSKLGSFGDWMKTEFPGKVEAGVRRLTAILSSVKDFFNQLGTAIKDGTGDIDWDMGGRKLFAGALAGITGGALFMGLKKLKSIFNTFSGVSKSISGTFDALTAAINNLTVNVKAKSLLAIAIALGVLSAAMIAMTLVDSKKLGTSLGILAGELTVLLGAMAVLNKLDGGKSLMQAAFSITMIGVALLAISKAVARIGEMPTENVVKGTTAVAVLVGALTFAAKTLASNEKKMLAGVMGISTMASAVSVLSLAVVALGYMKPQVLAKGVITIVTLISALAIAVNKMGDAKSAKGAAVMLALVLSLQGLGVAVAALSRMSWSSFASGIVKMAAVLGLLVVSVKALDGVKGMTGASSMLALVLSVQLLAVSIKKFAEMPWGSYLKGVVSMGVVMAALVAASKQLGGVKGMTGAGSMVALSASLIAIAAAIKILGSMSGGGLVAGVLAVVAVLGALILVARGTAGLGPGFLLFAAGVAALGAACALAGAGMALFATGLATVAAAGTGAFAVLVAGIGSLLTLLPLFGRELANAIVEFARVLGEHKDDIKLFFVGIGSAILESITILAPKLGEAATAMITAFAQTIIDSAPTVAEAVVTVLSSVLTSLSDHAQEMTDAGWNILLTFVQGIRDHIGEVTMAAGEAVVAFLGGLAANAQAVASSGMELLANFLQGIADGIPDVVTSASNVIVNFLNALASNIGDIVTAGANLLINFLNGIANNIGGVVTAATNVIVNFLNGIANNIPRIAEAGVNVIIAFIQAIAAQSVRIVRAAMEAILTFIRGITQAIHDYAPMLRQAGKNLLWEIINAMTGDIPRKAVQVFNSAKQIGSQMVAGIKQGFSSAWTSVSNWVTSKVNSIKTSITSALGIHSPSRVMADIFRWVPLGMVAGMERTETALFRKVDELSTKPVDILNEAFSAVDTELDVNPVLTPVLDLSQVTAGARDIRNLLDGSGTTYTMAADISRTTSGEAPRAGIQEIHNHYDINFEQNITAPKSLDAVDIARSTRGVLSEYERAMKGY